MAHEQHAGENDGEASQEALAAKERGNVHFKAGEFDSAVECYTYALNAAPMGGMDRAIFFANRAACFAKVGEHAAVVEDCCAALVIDSNYTKALIRRMTAHETLGQASLAALSLCMKEGAPFIAEVCAGARGSR